MEGTLDNRNLLNRSSSRPIIPLRDYRASSRQQIATIAVEPVTSEPPVVQQYSKVTPIYATSPAQPISRHTRAVKKGIEFVKVTKHKPAQHSAKRVQKTEDVTALDFVSANLDMVDLDLINATIEGNASLPVRLQMINEIAELPETGFIHQYFEQQSKVKTPKKTHHRLRLQVKHLRWFLVLTLLVGVAGVWGYVMNDSGASQKASALGASTAMVAAPEKAATSVAVDSALYNPKALTITKLNIQTSIESVDQTTSGAMGVPANILNAGWYARSSKPAQPGAVFIDGHSSSTRGALFGNLDTLAAGDQIQIERADGVKITYSVAKVSVVDRHDVDMASMLKPYGSSKNGLNIMSCVGAWIPAENTMTNRVLVYAIQI